jgi:hypothetical protein
MRFDRALRLAWLIVAIVALVIAWRAVDAYREAASAAAFRDREQAMK